MATPLPCCRRAFGMLQACLLQCYCNPLTEATSEGGGRPRQPLLHRRGSYLDVCSALV